MDTHEPGWSFRFPSIACGCHATIFFIRSGLKVYALVCLIFSLLGLDEIVFYVAQQTLAAQVDALLKTNGSKMPRQALEVADKTFAFGTGQITAFERLLLGI